TGVQTCALPISDPGPVAPSKTVVHDNSVNVDNTTKSPAIRLRALLLVPREPRTAFRGPPNLERTFVRSVPILPGRCDLSPVDRVITAPVPHRPPRCCRRPDRHGPFRAPSTNGCSARTRACVRGPCHCDVRLRRGCFAAGTPQDPGTGRKHRGKHRPDSWPAARCAVSAHRPCPGRPRPAHRGTPRGCGIVPARDARTHD